MLIRGHECVSNGIKFMFDQKVVTVFSASYYCGENINKSGVLMISENGEIEKHIFPGFQYLSRQVAFFFDNVLPNNLMTSIIRDSSLISTKNILTQSKKIIFPMKHQLIRKKSYHSPIPDIFNSL